MKRFTSKQETDVREEYMSDDDLITEQLRSGLRELEQSTPVFTPPMQWFQQQVEANKKTLRRKFIRDLSLFILVAIIVLAVSFSVYMEVPALYLVVQAFSMLIIPSAVWWFKRKRVER